ncbi:Hypothetical predicted protein [Pelobates cultripes]|uniref:PiggyBac transposable element-derived protein domain-containing protein n=1 Tax=Pelobates cultripes TaxID=61616 RepID=A0AAD1R5J4_PELCU|nr:Hypothetical predicted protein [Pelobates cultripes]
MKERIENSESEQNDEEFSDCWKYLFTGDILDIIVKYTNQYINIIKNKYGRERAAKLTDDIEIKAFIGILYLAGAYRALDLVEELKEMKHSYVGTVKKNKRELPPEFVTTKSREVYSSSFWIQSQYYISIIRTNEEQNCYPCVQLSSR